MTVCVKCRTRYTASYYDQLCQRCKDEKAASDVIGLVEDIAVGYALGSLIGGIFDGLSSPSSSSSDSDWSGGGGESGGGGAGGEW